ncbi:DUF2490 domain-containing protein [Hugenholtzia roseola]|uniref:DUF2490 domain-containing protein n=1 Tax=Hugenholtzia roseola TaxID=1002 RepID=UPI00047C8841|nr:DUF2490 domain-containing protein [Hugenholtzia roseola]
MKKFVLTSIFLLLQYAAFSQANYQVGLLPALNLNKKLGNGWSLNAKLESRQRLQRGSSEGEIDKKYNYVLTDLSMIAAKKVGLNSRIAGGYLVRLEDGLFSHRFIQQYVLVQKLSGWRLAHRLSSDQTFSEVEKPEYRIRYRITSEIPLNGESVDPTEFYLKLNNEYVNSLQENEYNLEIRLIPLLGYDISNNFKIEVGLDYRVSSFFNNNTRHSYWTSFNLFIDI